ncbi:MAG: hypothetical protein KF850_32695 [Labilithrix sp.]|nr:hypothetical protein [Labilithrix sp.]
MESAGALLLADVGRWRSHLLARAFGLTLLTLQWKHVASLWGEPRYATLSDKALLAVAVVLLALGSRVVALLAAAPVALVVMLERVFWPARDGSQVADEYLLYAVAPGFALLAAALAAHETSTLGRATLAARLGGREVDHAVVNVSRLLIVVTMAFAGLHKLNVDFLHEGTSCHRMLTRRLLQWWTLPSALLDPLQPEHIVAGELGAALALRFAPRLGVLLVGALVLGFVHVGPVAFGVACLSLSLSFLRDEDGDRAWRVARRAWPLAVVASAIVLAGSARLHRAPLPWNRFVIYEVLLVATVLLVLGLVVGDLLSARARLARGAGRRAALLAALGLPSPGRRAPRLGPLSRALALGIGAFLVAQGLAPYTGLKLRLSFAMLSNLRADDTRHNHLFMPRAPLVGARSPFLEITRASFSADEDAALARESGVTLPPRGLVAAWVVDGSLAEARATGVRFDLDVRDADDSTRTIADAARDRAFVAQVGRLSTWSRLFQKTISGARPQYCVH